MTLAEIRANDAGYKAAYDSYVKPSSGKTSSGSSSGGKSSSSSSGSSSGGYTVNSKTAAANQPGGYVYNPNLDYAANINNAISAGADYNTVQNLLDQRNQKIDNNYDSLGQYKGDSTTQRALDYINEAKSRESFSQYQYYLEEARRQEEAAKRAAIEQGVNNLMAQIPTINQTYDKMAQQAYINNRLGQKNLKNQLSAAGLSGTGTAESTYTAANANYENLLNSGEQARTNAIQGIHNDVANLRATGDISIADNAAKYNQMLAEAMRDDYWQNRNYEWNQNQFDQNMAFQQKMADAELVSASDKQKLQLAQLAAQFGNYQPLADLLGMSAADIAASMQTTAGTSAKNYSSGNYATKPRLSFAQTMDQIEAGNLTKNVLDAYQYYMGEEYRNIQSHPLDDGVEQVFKSLDALRNNYNDSSFLGLVREMIANGTLTEEQYRQWHQMRTGG